MLKETSTQEMSQAKRHKSRNVTRKTSQLKKCHKQNVNSKKYHNKNITTNWSERDHRFV